jgi:hypothetical protein
VDDTSRQLHAGAREDLPFSIQLKGHVHLEDGRAAGTAIRGTFPVALGTPAQVNLTFDATFGASQQRGSVSEWGPASGGGQREFTAGSWVASGTGTSSDASTD